MKIIWNGLIKENPTFVLLLGLCPALAVTTKFETAYMMGICVLFVLLFSNFVISLLRKLIPESVKIPTYILIIGTFVTISELLLKEYTPDIYKALGIYLPLIVVNCIVLGRALAVASKETVGKSVLDALGIGLGFLFALSMIALFREVLGSNTITIMDGVSSITGFRAVYSVYPTMLVLPMPILVTPAGAFLTLGFAIALFNKFVAKKGRGSNVAH